jgi:hypothetical protein
MLTGTNPGNKTLKSSLWMPAVWVAVDNGGFTPSEKFYCNGSIRFFHEPRRQDRAAEASYS